MFNLNKAKENMNEYSKRVESIYSELHDSIIKAIDCTIESDSILGRGKSHFCVKILARDLKNDYGTIELTPWELKEYLIKKVFPLYKEEGYTIAETSTSMFDSDFDFEVIWSTQSAQEDTHPIWDSIFLNKKN